VSNTLEEYLEYGDYAICDRIGGQEPEEYPILIPYGPIEDDVYKALEQKYIILDEEEYIEHDNVAYSIDDVMFVGDEVITIDNVYDNIDTYMEYITNNSKYSNKLGVDLAKRGFTRLDKEYADGWYGTNDDPQTILNDSKYKENIFEVTYSNLFEVGFVLWVRGDIDE
jgi:hypothetical protein